HQNQSEIIFQGSSTHCQSPPQVAFSQVQPFSLQPQHGCCVLPVTPGQLRQGGPGPRSTSRQPWCRQGQRGRGFAPAARLVPHPALCSVEVAQAKGASRGGGANPQRLVKPERRSPPGGQLVPMAAIRLPPEGQAPRASVLPAARRPRQGLRRRRPSSGGGGRGGPLPGDSGGCARPWAELLRAGSADLSPDGELPPLPAFPGPVRSGAAPGEAGCAVGRAPWPGRRPTRPHDLVGQEPGRGPERTAPPEVFTVGARTFSWTPFPPAPRGGGDPGRSYRVLLGARARSGPPARSPQRRPAPEPRGTPGAQEQLWEATLRSCPMCQADFAPSLAPLDIDGHLAQCLAESTEDVVW
ncbi:hypothetical protein GH733_015919, partial [Mirounga leonina]